jgi:uncharacterized oligopeptide transporter (OPT) family protein
MAWPLVIAGIFLAIGLILIKAPSPMLIAVGMYLPFHSTAAIFAGGLICWMLNTQLVRRGVDEQGKTRATNTGVLLSSGFIAGEALMAVLLAFLVLGSDLLQGGRLLPQIASNPWLGMLIFPVLVYLLVKIPLKASQKEGTPGVKLE